MVGRSVRLESVKNGGLNLGLLSNRGIEAVRSRRGLGAVKVAQQLGVQTARLAVLVPLAKFGQVTTTRVHRNI